MKLSKPFLAFSGASALAFACANTEDIGRADTASTGGRPGSGGAHSAGGTSATGLGGASSTSTYGGNGPSPFGGSSAASNGGNGAASSGGNDSALGGNTTSGGSGAGGVPSSVLDNASVILYHQSDVTDATTNRIFMRFFVENKSADPLPMAQVSVRYWMTSEVIPPTLHSYYAGPNISGETLNFVEAGANSYVEIRFTGNSISRGADLNASEFQLQIDSGTYNQADDFSFNPADKTTRPNDKITLYLASRLIWGCEPSGACPGGDVGAGGAGGAGGAASGGSGGAPITGSAGAPAGGSETGTGGTDAGGGSSEGGAAPGASGAPAGGATTGGGQI